MPDAAESPRNGTVQKNSRDNEAAGSCLSLLGSHNTFDMSYLGIKTSDVAIFTDQAPSYTKMQGSA
jgi:hypothetical protein